MKVFHRIRLSPSVIARVVFWVAIVGVILAVGSALLVVSYGAFVHGEIFSRFDQLKGNKPSHIFSVFPGFSIGQRFRPSDFEQLLRDIGYARAGAADSSCSGCYRGFGKEWFVSRPEFSSAGKQLSREDYLLRFEQDNGLLKIVSITNLTTGIDTEIIEHAPQRIGLFTAGRIRTQEFVPLAEIPVDLRLAVMGVEDTAFLEHVGVSPRAVVRALWKDLLAGRFVQGGSTITQQLMKNLFFSKEKVMIRKFKEAFYALIAEVGYSKEAILEAYLNEVYLGQQSNHEIHGVNEAAQFFFKQPVTRLTLSQGATLAAMIQAPNTFDPRRNPEGVLKRRNLVLKKMLDAEFILPSEYQGALQEPLGVTPADSVIEDIDYYLELALNDLPPVVQQALSSSSLSVYLPLRPRLQRLASMVLRNQLDVLEKRLRLQKRSFNQNLEGGLIAIDVRTCCVVASQGGRSYRLSPFNRVIQGRRQSGSLIKPFVFLTGLLSGRIHPDTILSDSPFDWEYDRKVWSPRNYDESFRGDVTAREALEQSLNVPTARLAFDLGLSEIVRTLQTAGIRSTLYQVPSLSLGSAEMTPLELSTAYLVLARLGRLCHVAAVESVYDFNGNELFRRKTDDREVFPSKPVLTVLDMMKGVLTRGTGRLVSQRLRADTDYFVGKTGTTSEYRDAWFVGFSPDLFVLVWIGFDEAKSAGLTGASAALPAWSDFVYHAKAYYLPVPFPVP